MKRKNIEPTKEELDSLYVNNVNHLLNRFASLMEHVQEIAFPSKREGVYAPHDLSARSGFGRFMFYLSSPMLSITFPKSTPEWHFYVILAWGLTGLIWGVGAVELLETQFGTAPVAAGNEENLIDTILSLIMVVIYIVITMASYWRWVEFIRDQRHKRALKITIAVFYVILVLASLYYPLYIEYGEKITECISQNAPCRTRLLFIYLLLILPLCTWVYTFSLNVAATILKFIGTSLRYLHSAHNPFPRDDIQKLAVQPISGKDNLEDWQLSDLAESELNTLHEWSSANMTSTDKRLLPTAVLFGVIGVFANTQSFSQLLDKGIRWIVDILLSMASTEGAESVWSFSVEYITVTAVIVLLIYFLHNLMGLFRNLVVQSLIIETCIVVKSVRDQETSDPPVEPPPKETRRGCFPLWGRLTLKR